MRKLMKRCSSKDADRIIYLIRSLSKLNAHHTLDVLKRDEVHEK